MTEEKTWTIRIALGLLVLAVTIHLPATAGENGLPEGWFPVGDGPAVYETVVSEDAGMDGRGLIIRSRDQEELRFGGVGQRIDASDYLGERVRLTGYLRPRGVEQHTGLWMRVDPVGGGDPLAFDNMMERPVNGTADWSQYEVVLDVPNNASFIFFGALLAGKGEVNVDQLNLEVVDESTPVTDLMLDK
ncbi:hypothetical protein [Natronospira bacteriovora]|uniref:CBM-cenC domain-containing protein n=1 Tax=Natronospira bacteriovora TaxID=3069753 RepID=A0ABU0W4Q4_9GAMM|nr:hypothetical protein [Natronospira sp. AB-CW4]MDQ2069005.1 hypothetical protein [Natronospira sp. AB-CW4]